MRLKRAKIAGGLVLLAGCATSPDMVRTELRATLTGHQETGPSADLDATGTALFRVDPAAGRICWDLNVRDIDTPVSAHIHHGAAGVSGPPVLTLPTPGPDGRSEGCATLAPDVASALVVHPHLYYVNVHTEAHPGGALRGQLRGQVRR